MASFYNLEPQPTAKVVLQTTSGDLALELFAKQTPLASRNFLQHCLDGYYNNTIFHRLVPDFIIQGGDPTGTGSGGISALKHGDAFQDEFHSRLKFNRRGLLGMANEGPDSNGSQFFLTLGATPELRGNNTMFGRIEGDTIYNLMKMADAELAEGEGFERPLYPTRITGAEVLVNPFEDMVARVKEAPRTREEGRKELRKRKKPAGKNVLSFGADDGEDEGDVPVLKKAKANPKLVSVAMDEVDKLNNMTPPRASKSPQTSAKPRKPRSPSPVTVQEMPKAGKPAIEPTLAQDMESESEDDFQARKATSRLEQTNAEIAALKASMKRTVDTGPRHVEKPKNALEAMIPATSTRGRKRGKVSDEKGAFDVFNSFKKRLEGLPASEPAPTANGKHPANDHNPEPTTAGDEEAEEEAELCDLHFIANCQSCKSWDDEKPDGEAEADGDDNPGWMIHQLTFGKDTLGKDLEWKRKMEEIEVIDPREKAKVIAEERRKGKGKGKGKDRR